MKPERAANSIDDSRDDIRWAYELERQVKSARHKKVAAQKSRSLRKPTKKLVAA